jgi:N-formylglutamate amidohydrolase
MMGDIPPNTIGYGAVVLPHLDEFQGFFIVDDKALHKDAVMAQFSAILTMPSGAIGALQATIVEGIITHNFPLVAATALALHGITKMPYFWIKATRESGGTRTEMFPLEAKSIRAAQIEINNLPLVKEIKARLRVGMAKRKLDPNTRTH